MLMKLTPAVNFINILWAYFLQESKLHSFSLVTVMLCDFLWKEYGQKNACKMLVKLTPGDNVINILHTFFYKSALRSFSLITVRICNFLPQKYWRKSCAYYVDEIDTWIMNGH